MTDALLPAALLYAEAGWRVFPLWWPVAPGRCACWLGEHDRAAKHPLIRSAHPKGSKERATCRGECGRDGHGLWDGTTDLERIAAWWTRAPWANIGINCGTSNLAVLDVDAKNGGTEALARLEKVVNRLPQTIRVWTGSGGGSEHRYFTGVVKTAAAGTNRKMPPLGANTNGLDIKSAGGYVVAPPSRHASGHLYRWADGPEGFLGEMADWPEILTRIRDTVAAANLRTTPAPVRPGPRGAGYGQAALDGVIRDYLAVPADHGLRNDALNKAAYRCGQLVARGHIGEQAARRALEYAASAYAAKDGWSQAGWTIDSGLSKGMANPRTPTGANA